MSVYEQPLYYEIAFGFIDIKRQIDLFERFIQKFSKIKVKRFLDMGCGPSLQLREIAKRGYGAIGLDINPKMLRHLKRRSREEGIQVETIQGDMTRFRLEKKVDFASIMMGTIGCIESRDGFMAHLDSVASSLKRGGLYLIDNFRLNWSGKNMLGPGDWTMRKDGVQVKTTYDVQVKDALTQMLSHTLRLDVKDRGRRLVFEDRGDVRMIFPQEFLAYVEFNKKFEFIGWFERDRIRRLSKASADNLTILRRK